MNGNIGTKLYIGDIVGFDIFDKSESIVNGSETSGYGPHWVTSIKPSVISSPRKSRNAIHAYLFLWFCILLSILQKTAR